jgi:two-component system cell cycle sensor histidine kinase/response regulator CckA
MISPAAISWLCGITSIVMTAAAGAATWRARIARRAVRAPQKRAQDVDLAKAMEADSRLASGIAHDLNDLLTAITGHAELLIASLDPSSASVLDALEIRRAALSAARLTNPLRHLSDGHRSPTDVIDVNAVTARTANSLQEMLGAKISVTLALDDDLKPIKIGPGQLDAIVLNLCIQARDAMPNGGQLTVTTTMHAHEERNAPSGVPGEYVRIVFVDTGGGLSAAALSKLFEPNVTAGAAGLAKVDAIVERAGGRIQVNSVVGVGTTFTIDLPAAAEPAELPDHFPGERALATEVLVVEDEPGVRELIKRVLLRAGHQVVTVASPRAALAALKRQPAFSLMLVDVVMPEMDGYDLVVEARKIAPRVPVVFMSAFAPDLTRHSSRDGFLAKPFTSESLASVVGEALSTHP